MFRWGGQRPDLGVRAILLRGNRRLKAVEGPVSTDSTRFSSNGTKESPIGGYEDDDESRLGWKTCSSRHSTH